MRGLASLPSGVVTFLLTDVVGSCGLWERAPEETTQAALVRHVAIVAAAVDAFAGVLLHERGEGDSTFSVFGRATDALAAARAAQQGLAAESWPEGIDIVARCALHTGEALEGEGDYTGPTVNRVARLRDLAGGGEILLSQATATLVTDHLPADCGLLDLGLRELRGLTRPEQVYRLVGPAAVKAPVTTAGGSDGSQIPLPSRLSARPLSGFQARVREKAVLSAAVSAAAQGIPAVVLIGGDAGIGKTALVSEAARAAHQAGATVLYGRSDEDLGVPYAPWVEALGHLVRHAPPGLLDGLGDRAAANLGRLVPEVADRLNRPAMVGADPAADRYLLFGSVLTLLRTVSSKAPLILVLDDLHWADEPSLQLMRHVASSGEQLPFLLLGTFRDHEPGASESFLTTMAAMRREPHVRRLLLTGLSSSEVVALVEAVTGQHLVGAELELMGSLHRETEGNPFFVWEIMRHLLETEGVRLSDAGRWEVSPTVGEAGLPETVREVVQRRVSRLGPAVHRALGMAAIIGAEFDAEVLRTALDASAEDVLDLLERAELSGLVRTLALGRYGFTHALIAHTLYEDLSSSRRALAHRRVAEAMEILGLQDQRVHELAYHWTGGEAAADVAKAMDYARRAGDQALAALAPDEAARWYRKALDLHASSAVDVTLQCELLLGLGEAYRQVGNPAFHETLLQAADLARRLFDTERLVRAALANSRGVGGVLDPERQELLEQALEAVGTDNSSARARLLARLAIELVVATDHERRHSLAHEAISVARQLDDPATLLFVLSTVLPALKVPATHELRRTLGLEALELADALDDRVMAFHTRLHLMDTALETADLALVDECRTYLMEQVKVLHQPALEWMVAWSTGSEMILRGDVEGGEKQASRALELGLASGQPDAATIYGGQLLCLRWHQGRDQELLEAMTDLVRERSDLPLLRAVVARLLLESGRSEEIQFDVAGSMPYDIAWAGAVALWAEVVAQLNRPDESEALYQALLPYPEYVISLQAVCIGAASHYLGLLAGALGRVEEADVHFRRAHDLHTRLGAPFHLARTELAWGLLLHGHEKARARTLFASARDRAAQHGCSRVEQQASQALQRVPS